MMKQLIVPWAAPATFISFPLTWYGVWEWKGNFTAAGKPPSNGADVCLTAKLQGSTAYNNSEIHVGEMNGHGITADDST